MLAQNELHTWNDMDMTLNIMCSLEYNKNGTWFAIISLKSILILKWHTIESWCKHTIMENWPMMIFVILSCIFKVIVM